MTGFGLGSFRDPGGFIFYLGDNLYRQVNKCYAGNFNLLMDSGLYTRLVERGLLIPHIQTDGIDSPFPQDVYKIIQPERVPFISYPYEWCFSQLKDAALLTLAIQRIAIEFGMTLKDASAYNVQFLRGCPIFIDTLSFQKYEEGKPWIPYRQFCQHFLAPLVLMSRVDIRLASFLRIYIDGIPLDLAVSLLPFSTRFSLPFYLHIYMHSKSQISYSNKPMELSHFNHKVSKNALLGLMDNLESAVKSAKWNPVGTQWVDYYNDNSYSKVSLMNKKEIVLDYLKSTNPGTVWDFGANNGQYSQIASSVGANSVSFDIDPACVEMNYLNVRKTGEKNILPLVMDITNPSASIGWDNNERLTMQERGPVDLVMALALIHHLAISNNLPFSKIARFLARVCKTLIIEFVPKSDQKVRKLLASREDTFPDYDIDGFEREFSKFFEIRKISKINDSKRSLYLMFKRS